MAVEITVSFPDPIPTETVAEEITPSFPILKYYMLKESARLVMIKTSEIIAFLHVLENDSMAP